MTIRYRIKSMVATGAGRRFVSNTTALSNQANYIDKWFESIVKPQSFYSEHSSGETRRYFYNIDMQGRLFLEETFPKNIATSIKDERFLNFFFTRVRWARPKDTKFLDDIGVAGDYPFVSRCGKEINHIRPAATPIVFHSLINQDLIYAGNLTLPFEHSRLALSEKTGRLYHQLYDPKGVDNTEQSSRGLTTLGYGLMRSSVAVALSERILPGPEEMEEENMLFLTPEGPVPIQWLPQDAEPGAWVLPGDGSN